VFASECTHSGNEDGGLGVTPCSAGKSDEVITRMLTAVMVFGTLNFHGLLGA